MSFIDSEDSCCPVCNKKFHLQDIQYHVNKCLFLNADESEIENKRFSKIGCVEPSSSKKSRYSNELNDEVLLQHGDDNTEFSNEVSFTSSVPLAEQMRPKELNDFFGQEHVLGKNKILRILLEKRDIPSMILWGPPGCGKTTLAHIIAQQCKKNIQGVRFTKMSATMSGINDVKEVIKIAKNELSSFKRRTVLFMDEIHRFNKLQQDVFLPHVESGTIILIGATTENPSFSLNNALLSRCRVIVLEKLEVENIEAILKKALKCLHAITMKSEQHDYGYSPDLSSRLIVDELSVRWLAEMCDGDARIALNSLHLALQSKDDTESVKVITLDDIKDGIKKSHMMYDKKGDEHYNIISALHKSIRASDDNASLYWTTRMLQGGEDPIYIARRLVRAASEDIGLADPMAVTMAVSAMQGCQLLGMPECDVLLAQCAVYLARAPKSREVDNALQKCKTLISNHQGPQPHVPLYLRNAPTRLMKDLGYSKGYSMGHRNETNLQYMPEGLEEVDFFND